MSRVADHQAPPSPGRPAVVLLAVGLVAGALAAFAPAAAQDPMRPLSAEPPAASNAVPTPQASPAAEPVAAPALQATRQAADGRWEALIDHRWRRRGDRVGGAAVAEVHGDRVVLARGSRRETLWLLPPLTPSRPATARP